MTPGELREYMTVLRECGAVEVEVPVRPNGEVLRVKLGGAPVPLAPAGFVDEKGAPVDLDEGNPWRDDEPEGDPVLAANFPAKPAA